ncbi:hypothetical protein NE237_004540 [Protea cynaroides]|uniref:Cytochrome P450 n=1 Tax=Protea cynaroides TaxID=273540 RepID=A0A9Q0KJ47_9MAGN|nr:hypothetical protein NE237_004540 [Protea cynaroides]
MEYSWSIIFLSLCFSAAITIFITQTKTKKTKHSLPPGPPRIPILGHIYLLRKFLINTEALLRVLFKKYGPIVTFRIGSSTSIFIASHSLAHEALIQNGAAFNYRPGPVTPSCIFDNSYTDCGSSTGNRWRFLRRNLTSVVLIPSRYKSFGGARRWVLQVLNDSLFKYHVESGEPVPVGDRFRYAMFCLLLFLCFGEKLDEKIIKEIEETERAKLAKFEGLGVFSLFPRLGKFIFRKSWHEMVNLRSKQLSVLLPLIKASRERRKKVKQENQDENSFISYINSLFDLEIKEEGGRKLVDKEIATLISEVLDAGSDTTSTLFEWIMANLIKNQNIQEKLYSEIQGVVSSTEEIKEDDLEKMPYLKAVVLEGLRLHPPTHFVLPHTVKEDIVLNGYLIPKNALVNFMVGEMGRDPKVWKDPMEFKPERFLGDERQEVDITGSKEIKMMPFSAGRRICPGLGLGTLHMEYFLANAVRDFKWMGVEGHDVDMSERMEFTVIMVTPLRAHVSPRPK